MPKISHEEQRSRTKLQRTVEQIRCLTSRIELIRQTLDDQQTNQNDNKQNHFNQAIELYRQRIQSIVDKTKRIA